MKSKPDLDGFLEGGLADKAEKPVQKKQTTKKITQPEPVAKIYREQKLYRLPTTITEALRDRAYMETKQTGRRVTETEIVEAALNQYLSIKI